MTGPADYDPEARRDTAAARHLAGHIRRHGAMTVSQYVETCLFDPVHGYYVHRPAIGANGDFVTAPEVSQVFGELLGLWCAVVWQQMGAPVRFDLVEYGPGRGTLMVDALRALAKVPACLAAARVRLVEVSPTLRAMQEERLADASVHISWHTRLDDSVAPAPSIIIANEVLDTAPVEQHVPVAGGGEAERCITLDEAGRLRFCTRFADGTIGPDGGPVMERRNLHPLVARDMTRLPQVAALLIDYGHAASAPGDTLQAVRGHVPEHPLTSPGEADLTAQVDFARLAAQCTAAGFAVDGPISQGRLLATLGAAERASRLMAANPRRAGEIEAGVARLLSPTGMGQRFKAIGVRTPSLPTLPGFPHAIS